MDSIFLGGADEAGLLADYAADLLVVLPFIDPNAARRTADILCSRAASAGLLVAVFDENRDGFIAMANHVYRASRSRLFGYVAEDAFPGRGWGKRVVSVFNHPDANLLGFNDGKWFGMLASFGVARRSWADQNYDGDFFHPAYKSHYADTELTLLAMSDRSYRYDANCVMLEVDYAKDTKKTLDADRNLFAARKKLGFNGRIADSQLLNAYS